MIDVDVEVDIEYPFLLYVSYVYAVCYASLDWYRHFKAHSFRVAFQQLNDFVARKKWYISDSYTRGKNHEAKSNLKSETHNENSE